jgi:hypothetical protein
MWPMSNRRRTKTPLPRTFTFKTANPDTYWNGELARATRVYVRVADHGTYPHYWAHDLVGTVRAACITARRRSTSTTKTVPGGPR